MPNTLRSLLTSWSPDDLWVQLLFIPVCMVSGFAVWSLVAFLFGAPLIECSVRTYAWATIMTFLTCFFPSIIFNTNKDGWFQVYLHCS